MKFFIEDHSTIDKSFGLRCEHFMAYVEFDDVDHIEVDVAAKYARELLEKNWDEEEFKRRYQANRKTKK